MFLLLQVSPAVNFEQKKPNQNNKATTGKFVSKQIWLNLSLKKSRNFLICIIYSIVIF